MFQSLSEKLSEAFKKFKNKGRLTEADVKEGMREIKLALLEADVNFKVVKDFIKTVSERAVGSEVLESLTPAQQVIKIVNDELTELMGGTQSRIASASKPPWRGQPSRRRASARASLCGISLDRRNGSGS